MQERSSIGGLQHATIGIGSRYEAPWICSRQDFVRRLDPGGSFGSGRSLIVNRFPLDTLRAITTRPAARSHHTPRSAAREVLGYQRGTPARLRTYSLLRYFPHSGYLQHWSY